MRNWVLPKLVSKSQAYDAAESFLQAKLGKDLDRLSALGLYKPLTIDRSGNGVTATIAEGLHTALHVRTDTFAGSEALVEAIDNGRFPLNEHHYTVEHVNETKRNLAYVRELADSHGLLELRVESSFGFTNLSLVETLAFARNTTLLAETGLALLSYFDNVLIDVSLSKK